jgi:hypothetical protein
MNAFQPESNKNDQSNPEEVEVEIIYDDSPGDTTVRPARFQIPREWPRPQLPQRQPPEPDKTGG